MNLRKKTGTACILFLAGAFIFSSCEIGLGETVDVDKPEISVVEPEVASYVRDSFVMSGKSSDDTSVEEVSVVLKRTGTKEKYGPYKGVMSPDKQSWTIEIDNSIDGTTGNRKLPDGEYQAVVTALDYGKRKNEVERSFNIDNTPPVLTMERPATPAASYSPDSYGQKFTLEGRVTDFSSTDLLEMYFYKDKEMTVPALCDEQGNAVPYEIRNPGEKLDLVLGSFGENGLYEKIYGNEKDGGKNYYGKIFAYDGSRKIPAQDGDKGNCTSEISFAGGVNGDAFSFILNPENNPTFSLSQYDALKKDNFGKYNFYSVPNGTTIGVDVSSGLDRFAIDDETIEIVAKKCNIDGTVTGEEPVVLFKAVKTKDGTYVITDEDEKIERASRIKTNGSYKRNISVDLSKDAGLVLNECYLVEVKGCDINGNEFKNPKDELYGFALTSSGKLPVLNLTSPDSGNSFTYINAEGSVLVKGTATHDEGIPKIHVYAGDTETASGDPDADGNFEFTISADKLKEGSNIINVQAQTGVIYSEEKRTVILDTVKPVFSNIQIYPVVNSTDSSDGSSKTYVNGKIKISGVLQDLYGVKETSYKIYAEYNQDGEDKTVTIKEGTDLSYPSFAITEIETDIDDLKGIGSTVNLVVELTASDEAGNIAVETQEGYIIDQSTDIPQIIISKEIISKPVASGEWNGSVKLPTLNQLEYLGGAITDDDGIASASIVLYEADAENFKAKDNAYSEKTLDPKKQTRVDFTAQMPGKGGYYYLVIRTTDINGKQGTYESFVKIMGDAPSVSIASGKKIIAVENEGRKEITLGGKVSGECSEGNPLSIYLLKEENGDFSKIDTWEKVWSGTESDWSEVLDLTQTDFEYENDGVYSIILRAVDENKKYTDISFNYIIDFTQPTVKITSPVTSEDGSESILETKDFTFQGISSDGSGTGVVKLFWQILENPTAPEYDDVNWSSDISGNVSYWSIEKTGMPEGRQNLFVYAEDEAGNKSTVEKKVFNLDILKPVLTQDAVIPELVTSKFKFSGTAFDSNSLSPSDTIRIYEDGVLAETVLLEKIDSENGNTWSSEIEYPSLNEDRKYTYSIKLMDAVGKVTEINDIEFIYDTQAPAACSREGKTFLINNVEYSAENENWYKVNNLQLEGYFMDSGSGVNEIVIKVYNFEGDTPLEGTEVSYDLVKVDAANSIYKYTALLSKIPSGKCTIKVSAKDGVRESETRTYHLLIDTSFPEIDFESKHLITNGNEVLKVTGSVSDTGSGVDYMQAYVGTKDNLVSTKADDPDAKENRGSIVLEDGTGPRDFTFVIDAPNEISKWFRKETLGETPGIFAVVYDKAGNSTSKLIGSITIDEEKPSVSILLPEENATVNKELTFSGTASDKNGLYKIELQYYSDKDENNEWQPLCSEITGFNWNLEIDPTSLEKVKDADESKEGLQLKIRAFVTDLAGNTAPAERIVTVDPNSDRPTILLGNMTNVGGMGCTLEYKNIFGSIKDDDGLVKDLWITLDKTLASNPEDYPEAVSLLSDEEEEVQKEAECLTKWVKINVDNNTWSLTKEIEDLEDDTEYELYFYCIDAKGGAFTSMANNEEERIVIKYKDDARSYAEKKGSLFSLSTDFPEFGRIEVTSGTSSVLAKDLENISSLPWRAADNYFFGGEKKYLYAKVEVLSRSAINANAPLTLKINNEDYDISVFNEEKNTGKGNLYLLDAYDVDVNGNPVTPGVKRDRKLYTYIAGPFDMGDEAKYPESSTAKFTFTAQGGSKRTAIKNLNILTDHSAPVAKIVYPSQSESVSANITVSGMATDGGAGTGKIEYRIPPETEWRTVSTSASFKIDFPPADQPEKNLAYYSKNYYAPENGEAVIPVYFRLTDELGNTAVQEDQFVIFDANGAVPKCEITFPVAGTAVSGPVKIKGTASGGNGVDEVHLQFLPFEQTEYTVDSTTGARTEKPGTIKQNFTNTDALKNYFEAVKAWPVFKYGEDLFALDSEGNILTGGAEDNTENISDWYVLADGKDSWSKLFNTEVLSEQTGDTLRRTTKLGIRAKAFKDGESRDWVSQEADINWESASIKNLVLVQKKNGEKGLRRNYENGLYIGSPETGYTWYLEGTFESADKTAEGQKLDSVAITNILSEAGSVGTETDFEQGVTEYDFSLPVNLTGPEGRIQLSLKVTNKAGKDTVEIVTFSVDKTAPQLFSASGNLKGGLRLYDITDEDAPLSESKFVRNSNSFFTFGDNAVDSGSGFSYLAFYFKRNPKSAGSVRIYDTFASDTDPSKIRVDLEGSVKINEDNLPVLEATASRPSLTQIKSSDFKPSVNPHVRTGGLVKIDGIYVLVKDVQADGTVTLDREIELTETKVQIVYAQIVDNTGAKGNEDLVESVVDGARTFVVRNDDGDGMKESYNVTGGKWSAAIRSDLIPDGPVEIHVVASDKAGNISHGYLTTFVRNNNPRLSKVFLGTDLDGNGKFDFTTDTEINEQTQNGKVMGEFIHYSCLDKNSGEAVTNISFDTNFTIKNQLALIPEFVGGNKNIKYAYEITDQDKNTEPLKRTDQKLYDLEATAGQNRVVTKTGSVKDAASILDPKGFVLITNEKEDSNKQGTKTTLNGKSLKGKKSRLSFTFWDNTEETVQGADSQYAFLSFTAEINTVDRTAPKNKVHKFFWKGLNDNSIFGSSSARRVTDLLGHIELEDDLTDAIKNKTVGQVALGDDPKVSGKIVIKGESFDDVKLSSLWVNFADENLNSAFASGNEVATRTSDGKKYYKAAAYDNATAKWICSPAVMENQKWEFKVLENTLSQSGHQVEWEFDVDTELVTNESGLDACFRILSVDDGYVGSDKIGIESEMDSESVYKMDVVPYVTQLITNLSSKNEDNPSIYSRSALGRYQVRGNKNAKARHSDSENGEDVLICGFNLGTAELTVKNIFDEPYVVSGSETKTEENFTSDASRIINIGDMRSGSIVVSANGIECLNNINDNGAKGTVESTRNCYDLYNMQANLSNNNRLTDDLEIDVWEFKNLAKKVATNLSHPTVRFNPATGVLGASFSNGIYFNMAGGGKTTQKRSHSNYMAGTNGFADSTFAYDKNGFTYGLAQSKFDSGTQGYAGSFRLVFGKYYSSVAADNAYLGFNNSASLEPNSINMKYYPHSDIKEFQNYAERIVSPQVVALTSDNNSNVVMLHVAYADTATNQIRYRRSYVSSANGYAANSLEQFNPSSVYSNARPAYYRITKHPDSYVPPEGEDPLKVGKEVPSSEVTSSFIKNEHYVDVTYGHLIAGSSLRNVNDVDSNFQMQGVKYNLSDAKDSEGKLYTERFTERYAVDFENGRIDQTTTGTKLNVGNKPMYPYSTFNNGMSSNEMRQMPDSLQNQAGQTIHVLASSGVSDSDVMDVYKKEPSSLSANGQVLYQKKNGKYKYESGKSVALGVSENKDVIIAWHDEENNKLIISYNTDENLAEAESKVAAVSRANGGTGGTLYGTSDKAPTLERYVYYPFNVNGTGSIYYFYYYINNTNNIITDADNDNFVDTVSSTSDYYTTQTISNFMVSDTGKYCTPTNKFRYRVQKVKKTTTVYTKQVTQLNGESKNEGAVSSEVKVDYERYLYNTNNTLTGYGAVLERKVLSGTNADGSSFEKTIFVPIRVRQTPVAESIGSWTAGTKTNYEDSGKTGKKWTETKTDVSFEVEYYTPEDGVEYEVKDGAYVLASYPVYKVEKDNNSYMGCATENTKLSFERTEKWEDNGKEIGEGGSYVQMKIVDGIIHMAYYEENDGAVMYTKLPFTSSGFGTPETYVVDSYNDVGEQLTLDVVKDSQGRAIPYIGYYGNKRAKLAYLKNPESADLRGSENDLFTGTWDICYIPSEKSISADRINVAVYADSTGKAVKGKDTADNVVDVGYGDTYVYSNATTNPVMGYINSIGNLEVGQKR